jgi:hypothetical protein
VASVMGPYGRILGFLNWLLHSLTAKLLLALDSTVILGCESQVTHDHILLTAGPGSLHAQESQLKSIRLI